MVLFIFSAPFWHNKMSISSSQTSKSRISVIWEKVTSPILREFFESRQLVTKNIYLPPWDLFLNSNEENNIIIWHFVRDKCQVPNSQPDGFAYIFSNLDFSFFDLFLMIFYLLFMKTWQIEVEESPDIHFPLVKCTTAWIWI